MTDRSLQSSFSGGEFDAACCKAAGNFPNTLHGPPGYSSHEDRTAQRPLCRPGKSFDCAPVSRTFCAAGAYEYPVPGLLNGFRREWRQGRRKEPRCRSPEPLKVGYQAKRPSAMGIEPTAFRNLCGFVTKLGCQRCRFGASFLLIQLLSSLNLSFCHQEIFRSRNAISLERKKLFGGIAP